MVDKTRVGMPLDEFLELSHEQPFDLINGERIPLMPGVAVHGETIRALFLAIWLYISTKLLGDVITETTFILPDTYDSNWVEGSRTPDVMYYAAGRLQAYKAQTPDWQARPYALVPDFVAEVVSPNDKFSELDKKSTPILPMVYG